MEGYFPLKMKRKDLEDVSDDFSDFSLSSPARKIRRLQSHRNRDLLAPFGPRLPKILSFEDVMPKVVAWSLLEPGDVAVVLQLFVQAPASRFLYF